MPEDSAEPLLLLMVPLELGREHGIKWIKAISQGLKGANYLLGLDMGPMGPMAQFLAQLGVDMIWPLTAKLLA